MGRTEPSLGRPPPALRRDARAKKARATLNKVIPALLSAHPRARRGVEQAELIIDPPPIRGPTAPRREGGERGAIATSGKRNGKGIAESQNSDEAARGGEQLKRPLITLRVADTLAAAHSLLYRTPSPPSAGEYRGGGGGGDDRSGPDLSNAGPRVGILNMASPLSPGGGFLNGATSQEESLCMCTTLLPSLRDEFYRLPELGAIYTPDVLVFRSPLPGPTSHRSSTHSQSCSYADIRNESGEDVLPKSERWFVSCVTAAMLRLPETEEDTATATATAGACGRRYASDRDREAAARKMRAVMRVFRAKGCRRVVLGAWGCGAYGNPVGEVARAWRKVLLGSGRDPSGKGTDHPPTSNNHNNNKKNKKSKPAGGGETWDGIEEIVFAIKDAGLAAGFAEAFGAENLALDDSREGGGDMTAEEEEEEEEEEAEAKDNESAELRAKIRELEAQAGQARSPHLRAGLGAVLAGLRSQLPEEEEEEEEEEGR